MLIYLGNLFAIGATMIGGAFLLGGEVVEHDVSGAVSAQAPAQLALTPAKVLSPTSSDAGRLYALVKGGARPARFMIDTGASYTVLTRSDADDLGVRQQGMVQVDTLGGAVIMPKGYVPRMQIGDVVLTDVDVLVADQLTESLLGIDTMRRLGATHLSFQPA